MEVTESEASDDYACSVTLIVTGAELDPTHVTQLIGLSPSQAWKKGETKTFKSGKTFIYPWGGWKLFQPADKATAVLEELLDYWAATLAGKRSELGQLHVLDYSVTLDCFIGLDRSATASLKPDLIARLSAIGVGVTLNITPTPA